MTERDEIMRGDDAQRAAEYAALCERILSACDSAVKQEVRR